MAKREKKQTPAQKRLEWTEMVAQPVEREGLRMRDGAHMEAACHHKAGKRRIGGACPGCYARLYTLMLAIEGGAFGPAAKALGSACGGAMKADKNFPRSSP